MDSSVCAQIHIVARLSLLLVFAVASSSSSVEFTISTTSLMVQCALFLVSSLRGRDALEAMATVIMTQRRPTSDMSAEVAAGVPEIASAELPTFFLVPVDKASPDGKVRIDRV